MLGRFHDRLPPIGILFNPEKVVIILTFPSPGIRAHPALLNEWLFRASRLSMMARALRKLRKIPKREKGLPKPHRKVCVEPGQVVAERATSGACLGGGSCS